MKNTTTIQIGQQPLKINTLDVNGHWTEIEGTPFYKISNYDQMPPFFMSLASDAALFLFISSKGALTAGRKDPQNAIFPYYTVDKIHDSTEITGSKTIVLVTKDEKTFLWEPFSDRYNGIYTIERNLYKNQFNTQLLFEEYNKDLDLIFSYSWTCSKHYGIIKKSKIISKAKEPVNIRILDGLQNLLPSGINLQMQTDKSNLLDAYKKSELLEASGIGLYMLSSIPVDRAEPSEALLANMVWSIGLTPKSHLLSLEQIEQFRRGQEIKTETDIRARRGAYFIESDIELDATESKEWYFLADLNKSISNVREIEAVITSNNKLIDDIEKHIQADSDRLRSLIAKADGIQKTNDTVLNTRHFANVLFNSMRGGIFLHNDQIQSADFANFIHDANKFVWNKHIAFLNALPASIAHSELKVSCARQNDDQLTRLFMEYLPICFSRRHGDPSRPWNKFSIETEDEKGNPKMYYEGNWRDIFQNWEALALSFPDYLESMIAKFVNASTIDGYNPYRISRNGVDWEVLDEDDPWSYIGYWGDHQIIYLLKFLELSADHHPKQLLNLLNKEIFSFSNVPYRIKSFRDILSDPNDTIDFDFALESIVQERAQKVGSDGKLILNEKGEIYLVNLTEKLLISLLAKMSNFVPDAGIWLNTQRPEWNDANNALVGHGSSMVTVNHLFRFVQFCENLFIEMDDKGAQLSTSSYQYFKGVLDILKNFKPELENGFSNQTRYSFICDLGQNAETYRNEVYQRVNSNKTLIKKAELLDFLNLTKSYLQQTIQSSHRKDGLFHAYNLLDFQKEKEVSVEFLDLMLEGQVAVLSAGILSPNEVANLLDNLKASAIYRQDQDSYILYPDKHLKRFIEKNVLPANAFDQSVMIKRMIDAGDKRIVEKDRDGSLHFNSKFRNANELKNALKKIPENAYPGLDRKQEVATLLNIYETVFNHKYFTGRSGSFFGYEGLGSIYWHMVSKLLLAVAENFWWAVEQDAEKEIIDTLRKQYYAIKAGLGVHKSPENYGAFPTDPYSHTPANAGVKQPGMTGQVKEDILSRFLELGIKVRDGKIFFRTDLLESKEFIQAECEFEYIDLNGAEKSIGMPSNCLAFTYCQIPVVYHRTPTDNGIIITRNNEKVVLEENHLNVQYSKMVFERTGEIELIEVNMLDVTKH